jgi:hypothetical protein
LINDLISRLELVEEVMPVRGAQLANSERSKRIREAAREHETDNDPASFERAFAVVARGAHKPKKSGTKKSWGDSTCY